MRKTPVTVKCDHLGCPEVDWSITLADDITPLPLVRRRAWEAGADAARSHGWQISANGRALCPLHARGATPLLLAIPTHPLPR